jgi:hypothetical protein
MSRTPRTKRRYPLVLIDPPGAIVRLLMWASLVSAPEENGPEVREDVEIVKSPSEPCFFKVWSYSSSRNSSN